jgi:Ni/Fe-hydrogenase subunit HybB-like protein
MATHEHAPVGGKLFTVPVIGLIMVLVPAGLVLLQRFIFGLGSVTNLSDGYPWGMWIAIDLIIGTALGCGGLVMAFLVYILNRGEYHPIVRAALMTSLFGYALGAVAVMVDLGRWWQGHNILLPWLWNPNSVLLETALCIFVYIMVLMVEFAPTVLERFGMKNARRRLHRVLFIFTGLGCLLPMMHQSSMGTVVILLGYKLSPLWQSHLLTLNFLLTAFTIGYAVVVFESVLSSAFLKRPFETAILSKLCGVMAWVQIVYMVVRFGDVVWRGAWPLAFAGDVPAWFFWLEFAMGAAAVLLLLPKANRTSLRAIFLGASAMLMSGVLYRLNCYLIGYDPGNGWTYFPSAGEIIVTVGIFAFEVLLYVILVKNLPVLHALRRT